MAIALILLAAGRSARMQGQDKLLQPVTGLPCLRAMALRGLKAGADVYIALGPDQAKRRAVLAGLDVTIVEVPDAAKGMSRSLRAAIAAVSDTCTAAIILPADMPEISHTDIRALMDDFTSNPETLILRAATQSGLPGHPILFSRQLFDGFKNLDGDRGAFHLVRDNADHVRLHKLEGERARLDLDTPEEWARWQAHQNAPPKRDEAER